MVVGALRAKPAAAAAAAVPVFLALLERDFPAARAAVVKFRGSGDAAVGPAVSLDELVEGGLVRAGRAHAAAEHVRLQTFDTPAPYIELSWTMNPVQPSASASQPAAHC